VCLEAVEVKEFETCFSWVQNLAPCVCSDDAPFPCLLSTMLAKKACVQSYRYGWPSSFWTTKPLITHQVIRAVFKSQHIWRVNYFLSTVKTWQLLTQMWINRLVFKQKPDWIWRKAISDYIQHKLKFVYFWDLGAGEYPRLCSARGVLIHSSLLTVVLRKDVKSRW
jgi:hypothetical protein